jgi:hypothetical protein
MEYYEIICINKPAADSTYEQISAIGYQAHDGKAYILSKDEAIEMIKNKEAEFYVQSGNNEIVVKIEDRNGQQYLSVPLDNRNRNALLNLRECKPHK